MIKEDTLTQYEKALNKDPKSKAFALLAEAYRENGQIEKAEQIVNLGLQYHPDYVGGQIAKGRIKLTQGHHHDALDCFQTALKLAPDNLLAYQLLGDTYLILKQAKEALKTYKTALFINPHWERAQKIIEKIEVTTAEEFESDLFQMQPLQQTPFQNQSANPAPSPISERTIKIDLDREISFIDALLIRGDLNQAQSRIQQLLPLFPAHPELAQRYQKFIPTELPELIRPLPKRERRAWEQKRQSLDRVLKAIQQRRAIIAKQHFIPSPE